MAGLGKGVLKDLNTVEMEILSKDLIWHIIRILPYQTTTKLIDGVVINFFDVHTIKRAEGKIRRLATVLEDANDAVVVLDLKGRILAWNKGAQRMYGWTEPEALQMNYSDLWSKDRKKEFGEIVHELVQSKTLKSFKTRRITKEGKILDTWLTASALTDTNGRFVEMAITERDLAWLA